jgi:hypothetical protein
MENTRGLINAETILTDSIRVEKNSRGFNYEIRIVGLDVKTMENKINEVKEMIARQKGGVITK